MIRFCPECYSLVSLGESCACACAGAYSETRHIWFGAPGESPSVIGHLTILDATPPPWQLMEGICDGPRRYPGCLAQEARCGCWRHNAHTVWMWQQSADDLPAAGSLPPPESPATAMLRVMAATGLLLVEAPQPSPIFRARYARNRTGNPAPPEFAEVIDRLQWTLSLFTSRRRAIALLDSDNGAGEEDRARLAEMSAEFGKFNHHGEALRWLLKQSASFSTPLPSPLEEVNGKEEGDKKRQTPDLVRVADLGGSVGRSLMARLHHETWAAMEARMEKMEEIASAEIEDAAPVGLPGGSWFGPKYWAHPTEEGLRYGRVQQLRQGEPPPGSPAPAWEGRARRWWRRQAFTVQLEEDSLAENDAPLIIGIGPSRLFGERELSDLLERLWRGNRVPVAIIRHARANNDLLRWVRNEFPQTPEFPDSRAGERRALETALRAARERTQV